MALSDKTIKEFQDIVRKEYGRNLSLKDARKVASDLVGYFDILAKIYHQDQLEGPESPTT